MPRDTFCQGSLFHWAGPPCVSTVIWKPDPPLFIELLLLCVPHDIFVNCMPYLRLGYKINDYAIIPHLDVGTVGTFRTFIPFFGYLF